MKVCGNKVKSATDSHNGHSYTVCKQYNADTRQTRYNALQVTFACS